jgi:eukaryotic-like serine/threonine-protein kinase
VNERSIFLAALDIDDPARRAAYVAEACGGNVALRGQVEELLRAHGHPGGFMKQPAPAIVTVDEPPATDGPGAVIGPYKLLEQIGEGGFGVVFMAEQQRPVRRRVALKVLKPGMDTRQVVARFEAERQALAMMDHPNIAKVYDAGSTEAGRPYFVMELVRGVPITEFCDHNRLPVRERLELFAHVCQAVQHAHQKGVIHRDIKPSNVLVTLHDGVPVAKVIDFGVAKAMGQQLTERTLFTNFAQMVGTPLYMSPEQAEMSGLDVDTRADIYALGVLLYELLTGTTPFDSKRFKTAGYDEIRRIIREEEPARPSTRISTLGRAAATISANRKSDPQALRRQCRGELDWIVMKCLEKDRNRRYETAAGLASDVKRFLADEPVQACPPSAWYRLRKLARRHKRVLAMVSVLAVAALVGVTALAVSTVLVWRANQGLTDSLDRERRAADRERREAYFQRIAVAQRDLSADNLASALQALRECPEELRGWEWHYLMRLCKVEPLVLHDTADVTCVAFSPDGERVVSAGGDGTIKTWDSRTGQVVQRIAAHAKSTFCVAFHSGGRHVASSGDDGRAKVWDLTTGREVFAAPCSTVYIFGNAYTVAFSPDGRLLAAGSDRVVNIWDWAGHQLRDTLPGHDRFAINVAFSRDGRLATGSWRGGVRLWNLAASGELQRTFNEHRLGVTTLAFSSDGGRLASGGFDSRVHITDPTTGTVLHTLRHPAMVNAVAFHPDGRCLASTGEGTTVRLWDAATGREVLNLRGHVARCTGVAFSPDGHRMASASMDKTIRIWDATPLRGDEGQELFTFEHPDEVWQVAVSPDGQRVASTGRVALKVWDPQTRRATAEFRGHPLTSFSLTWHPDGGRIASAGHDGTVFTVKVFDAGTGEEVYGLPPTPETFAAAFSPDGRYLLTAGMNRAVQVWEAATGAAVGTLGAHPREVRGLTFSRDGKYLASTSGDGTVKLWDATHLAELEPWDLGRVDEMPDRALRKFQTPVPGQSLTVAFSPDGKRLVTGGEGHTVKVWDVPTGNDLQTLRGHTGFVYTVAFSPDGEGRWIASAGEDSTVKVWDSRTGRLVRSFRGHTALVMSLAFGPDGKRLYSGSRDHTMKVWDLTRLGEAPGR